MIHTSASPPRSDTSSTRSLAIVSDRDSYILDAVPEDPSDADDYMIPHTSANGPPSPHPLRNRRSLPRMGINYSPPQIIIPTEDNPMPDWNGEVSPTTIPPRPWLAELQAEQEHISYVSLLHNPTPPPRFSRVSNARRLINSSSNFVRKMAGQKRGAARGRRTAPPPSRASAGTFELLTPRRKLENQPSLKSRAKRAARGAVHSFVNFPETSVEVTAQSMKSIRKSASKTSLRMVNKVEDAMEKVNPAIPAIRPPRARYSALAGRNGPRPRSEADTEYVLPMLMHWSKAKSKTQLAWSAHAAMDAVGAEVNIPPPPPSPKKSRPRNGLRKSNPPPPRFYQIPATYSNGEHMNIDSSVPKDTTEDAKFEPALVSDIEWQAPDAAYPMIIVTEGQDQAEGSWYVPLNSVGQIQLHYTSASHAPSTPVTSPRGSMDTIHTDVDENMVRREHWYNGRSSMSTVRTIDAFVGDLRGVITNEDVVEGLPDHTPLLVEFLDRENAEETQQGQREAVLWAPVGNVML